MNATHTFTQSHVGIKKSSLKKTQYTSLFNLNRRSEETLAFFFVSALQDERATSASVGGEAETEAALRVRRCPSDGVLLVERGEQLLLLLQHVGRPLGGSGRCGRRERALNDCPEAVEWWKSNLPLAGSLLMPIKRLNLAVILPSWSWLNAVDSHSLAAVDAVGSFSCCVS